MRYADRGFEAHVLELTAAETDFFFEPFDINDVDMPGHLSKRGHRYLKLFAYEWLMANISTDEERRSNKPTSWYHSGVSTLQRSFVFPSKAAAMQFKLAWEGKCGD